MLRKALLSAAALIALAFVGMPSAEAGGCYRGGGYYGRHHHHHHHYRGGYPVYRSYYGGPGYYRGSGFSYYRGFGGYGRSYSGVGISIGF